MYHLLQREVDITEMVSRSKSCMKVVIIMVSNGHVVVSVVWKCEVGFVKC